MPMEILLSIGSEAEKKGVRGWGISEKGTGTREGAGEEREGERGRKECVGEMARGEGMG